MTFFKRNNILYKSQYGFREKRSTNQAILELVSDIVESLENKKSTLGVFIDLSKAFDTINHEILSNKLYFYGVRGIAHQWIKSYLNDRMQYVYYDGCKSDTKEMTCGVPQGSILGPLLFIIYANNLHHCLDTGYRLYYLQMIQHSTIRPVILKSYIVI